MIATKFDVKFENGSSIGLDSRPAHIREVTEASLKRVETDRSISCISTRLTPLCRSRMSPLSDE